MPTTLDQILDLDRLEALIASRHIVRVRHPSRPVCLYDYTARTQFEKRWTPETRAARGIVAHDDGTVLARPLEKFFNLGEHDVEHQLPTGPIEITEKLDGSLVILWHDRGVPAMSTRGSFTSDQAAWALAWLQRNADLRGIDPDLTLCLEFVSGARNRVVVDYGEREEVVLVAARRISDGSELDREALAELAGRHRIPLVQTRTVSSLQALIDEAQQASGIEGWVFRGADGVRIKLKVPEYHRLHRVLLSLSPKTVRDALGTEGGLEALQQQLPEEFWPGIRAVAEQIEAQAAARLAALRATHAQLLVASDGTRRGFAALVAEQPRADARHHFALLDGRDVRPWLLAEADLAGLGALLAPGR